MNLFVCKECDDACRGESNSCAACGECLCDSCVDSLPKMKQTKGRRFTITRMAAICRDCWDEKNETLVDKVHRFAKENVSSFFDYLEEQNIDLEKHKMKYFLTYYNESEFVKKFKDLN